MIRNRIFIQKFRFCLLLTRYNVRNSGSNQIHNQIKPDFNNTFSYVFKIDIKAEYELIFQLNS